MRKKFKSLLVKTSISILALGTFTQISPLSDIVPVHAQIGTSITDVNGVDYQVQGSNLMYNDGSGWRVKVSLPANYEVKALAPNADGSLWITGQIDSPVRIDGRTYTQHDMRIYKVTGNTLTQMWSEVRNGRNYENGGGYHYYLHDITFDYSGNTFFLVYWSNSFDLYKIDSSGRASMVESGYYNSSSELLTTVDGVIWWIKHKDEIWTSDGSVIPELPEMPNPWDEYRDVSARPNGSVFVKGDEDEDDPDYFFKPNSGQSSWDSSFLYRSFSFNLSNALATNHSLKLDLQCKVNNGNPISARVYLERSLDQKNWIPIGVVEGTSYTDEGLQPNTRYYYRAKLNKHSAPLSTTSGLTTPAYVSLTGTNGGISWSKDGGRGFATLSWPAVPGANGYKVYVFDGHDYRAFDVGTATSWDSRTAKIYPTEQRIAGYGLHTRTDDIFSYSNAGLDLRDIPISLYKSASFDPVGRYDATYNYWFHVVAYNEAGESGWEPASKDVYTPILPNRTDTEKPVIKSVDINGGQTNTGSRNVTLNVVAEDPAVKNHTGDLSDDASGIAVIHVSNDNFATEQRIEWDGKSPINWAVSAGEGTKNIAVKVEDRAGNLSTAMSGSIYLINDTQPPTISSLQVNYGATQTTSNKVSLQINLSDNLTTVDKLQMRVSTDGKTWYFVNADGNSWNQSNNAWGPYVPNVTYFNIGNTPGPVPVFVQVRDQNGNVGNGSTQIIYITSAISPAATLPTQTPNAGSKVINLNGYVISYNGTPVEVIQGSQLRLQLKGMSNVTGVRFSTNAVDWSPYEPVSGSSYQKDFSFETEGAKSISIQFRNEYGVESSVITRNYLVDSTAPTVKLATTTTATATSATSMKMSVLATDNVSKKDKLLYSFDQNIWSPLPANGTVDAPIQKGMNGVTVYVVDESGNVGQSNPITIWGL